MNIKTNFLTELGLSYVVFPLDLLLKVPILERFCWQKILFLVYRVHPTHDVVKHLDFAGMFFRLAPRALQYFYLRA